MPPVYGWWQSLSQGPYVMRFQPRSIWRARAAYRRAQLICIQYRLYSFEYPITNKWVLAWKQSGGRTSFLAGMSTSTTHRPSSTSCPPSPTPTGRPWWRTNSHFGARPSGGSC